MTESTRRIAELQRELAANPGSRQFYQLGELLRRDGRPAEAAEMLRAGLAHHPRYVAAWVALGRACLEAGASTEAAAGLHEALTLDAGNPVAWRLLGEAHLALGERAQALDAMKRCLEMAPGDEVVQAAVEALSSDAAAELSAAAAEEPAASPAESAPPPAESAGSPPSVERPLTGTPTEPGEPPVVPPVAVATQAALAPQERFAEAPPAAAPAPEPAAAAVPVVAEPVGEPFDTQPVVLAPTGEPPSGAVEPPPLTSDPFLTAEPTSAGEVFFAPAVEPVGMPAPLAEPSPETGANAARDLAAEPATAFEFSPAAAPPAGVQPPEADLFTAPESDQAPALLRAVLDASAAGVSGREPVPQPASLTLARLYVQQQALGEAVSVLERLLEREPDNVEASDLLALVRDMMAPLPEAPPPLAPRERKIAALQRWLASLTLGEERAR